MHHAACFVLVGSMLDAGLGLRLRACVGIVGHGLRIHHRISDRICCLTSHHPKNMRALVACPGPPHFPNLGNTGRPSFLLLPASLFSHPARRPGR